MLLKTYNGPSNIYSLHTIPFSDVQSHCTGYLAAIDVDFHVLEVTHQEDLMKQAVSEGMAFSVHKDGVEAGFIYIIAVGKIRGNMVALSSVDMSAKAILVHKLYSLYKILRYTPRDPLVLSNSELLQPMSMKMYKMSRVSLIKMVPVINTVARLDMLGLVVV